MTASEDCSGQIPLSGKALLKALAGTNTVLCRDEAARAPATWRLKRDGRLQARSASAEEVRRLMAEGLIAQCGDGVALTREGRLALRRRLSAGDGFLNQHREIVHRSLPETASTERLSTAVNLKESPLAWLASRKDRQGRALLDRYQVEAGERLRADYDFAGLQPSVSAGWRVETAGKAKRGGRGLAGDLRDDVLAARQRVTRTLTAMEPVLASIAVDVCCHLKGLEKVEAERGWPARSGKVVLQIALASLADRYGLRTVAGEGKGRIHSQRQR